MKIVQCDCCKVIDLNYKGWGDCPFCDEGLVEEIVKCQ